MLTDAAVSDSLVQKALGPAWIFRIILSSIPPVFCDFWTTARAAPMHVQVFGGAAEDNISVIIAALQEHTQQMIPEKGSKQEPNI